MSEPTQAEIEHLEFVVGGARLDSDTALCERWKDPMPDIAHTCDTGFTRERAALDALDNRLVELLATRYVLVEGMMRRKKAQGLPPRDLRREDVQNARLLKLAHEHGVDYHTLLDVFEAIRKGSLALY